MYRLSTQSTSSTIIAAVSRGEIEFSPIAIISGIHNTLVEKSYPQKPNVCSSALKGLGERIVERVQREVTAVLLETGLESGVDWENRVFRPIIATFDIVEKLGICQEDSEYIFVLVTVLSLAFELLLLVGKDKAQRTRTFLARTFRRLFVEPEICRTVEVILDAERARLTRMNAEMRVLRAIQGVRMLLPDITMCTAAWDERMLRSLRSRDHAYYLRQQVRTSTLLEPEARISWWSETAATTFFQEAKTFASMQRLAAAASDVRIKVFLKHGSWWLFDFVTSVDLDWNRVNMNTSKGFSMELEVGCSVSPVAAVPNKMSIKMPKAASNGFTGTISIPPGCSYRVVKVEGVREKTSDVDWTTIETADAVLEVGGGDYLLKRVNVGTRVIIENVGR